MRTILIAVLFISGALCAAASARADEKSHLKAAADFLVAMQADKQMQGAMQQSLDMQIRQSPRLAPVKDVMKKFFETHLGWEALKDDLAKLYAEEFTEEELKELTKFYLSPVGKKSIEKMPALTAKAGQLSGKRMELHRGELQRLISEELQKGGGPGLEKK